MQARVLVVDDHAVVREGLKMILESHGDITVVGSASNGREAIAMTEELRPGVVVMDIAMPELNGIEATGIIRERMPAARVIILSMHHTKEHIFRSIRAGAWGFLLKESAGSEIVNAVGAVLKGHRYFGKDVELPTDKFFGKDLKTAKSPLDSLSVREREVLQLVVEGKTSAEIAGILTLSPKSVETYRSRLMIKLGIDNIPSLVKFALLQGITPH